MSERTISRIAKKIDKMRQEERQLTFLISQAMKQEQVEILKVRNQYSAKRLLMERRLQYVSQTLLHSQRELERAKEKERHDANESH